MSELQHDSGGVHFNAMRAQLLHNVSGVPTDVDGAGRNIAIAAGRINLIEGTVKIPCYLCKNLNELDEESLFAIEQEC